MRSALALSLFTLLAADAGAATVLVTNLGDAAGSCPHATACTLRAALAAAQANDRIEFDPALAYPATLQLASGELVVNKNLVVAGPGADRLAIRAAPNARVLSLTGGVLELEALTLSHGTLQPTAGMSGGPGVAGQSGQVAEGGCLRSSGATQLVLDRVALHTCSARGANGGNGGFGVDAFSMAGAGGAGGSGGNALGGAIYAAGQLTLLQTSISGAAARGGAGGDGGDGGDATTSGQGTGGNGGNGGAARGGAIYIVFPGSLLVRNSTLVENLAAGGAAGDGGNGGNNTGTPGNGGAGGIALGGQVYIGSNVALADFEFATLGASASAGGMGGQPGFGGGSGMAGLQGALQGELLFTLASGRARTVVFAGGFGGADCEGLLTASGRNADSDDSCAGFDTNVSYAGHFLAAQSEAGRAVLRPQPAAPVIDAAPDCLDLAGAAVALDQSSRTRPLDGNGDAVAACDLGAIEYSPTIFRDGFEG